MALSLASSFLLCTAAITAFMGCSPDAVIARATGASASGSGGASASAGSGDSGGSGAATTSTASSASISSSTGAGAAGTCGGMPVEACAPTEWCHFASNCGCCDQTGVCKPLPTDCGHPECTGVCGCDGKFYCTECDANKAGVDVNPIDTSCLPTCAAATDAIAAKAGGTWTCTSVVRLDYTTRAIKGYAILCAPYGPQPDEATARATAQADTGFGQSGSVLTSPPPSDEYVFYQAPGDFGGVAAVNLRNGRSVFGGSIIWLGTGNITYPTSFSPASDLAAGCTAIAPPPTARGVNLDTGGQLAKSDVDAAMNVVWNTALPNGLAQVGYYFDAMVLLYPPGEGAFNPSVAEWIVLVNTGWLE